MTILSAIQNTLTNHLATTPASPPPALPAIAWPNMPYTRVAGTPYIRAEFIPSLRRPAVVGPNPDHRTSGLFYLTVYTPEDQGASAGMAIADKLMSRFNGHSSIVAGSTLVRIEYSEAKMPLHDTPFYAIPVEIGWYSYSG